MPKGAHRKHTPIVSKKQQGLFGAELQRRKEGRKGRVPSITTEELRGHLKESKGKELPKKASGGAVVTGYGSEEQKSQATGNLAKGFEEG